MKWKQLRVGVENTLLVFGKRVFCVEIEEMLWSNKHRKYQTKWNFDAFHVDLSRERKREFVLYEVKTIEKPSTNAKFSIHNYDGFHGISVWVRFCYIHPNPCSSPFSQCVFSCFKRVRSYFKALINFEGKSSPKRMSNDLPFRWAFTWIHDLVREFMFDIDSSQDSLFQSLIFRLSVIHQLWSL